MRDDSDVVIVGAGFTGLSAGLSLARSGKKVTLVEMEENPGGLAGTFSFKDGIVIEKYYHHWFTHDSFVLTLAESLGLGGKLKTLKSRTGMFFQKKIWNMSTPLDLLRFDALPFLSRIRLGLVVLGIRFIRNWRSIEHLTVKEWLEPLCGKRAYAVVWEPLIRSKFGSFAESVNAVWFWKKLVLRGSTRDSNGNEQLMYFDGGFGDFSRAIATELCRLGGEIITSAKVTGVTTEGNAIKSLQTSKGAILGKQFLFTAAFPQIAEIVDGAGEKKWTESLRRLNYLGNICLVLELSKSLSDTYWLNVNDPGFPFVGVIEHTNRTRISDIRANTSFFCPDISLPASGNGATPTKSISSTRFHGCRSCFRNWSVDGSMITPFGERRTVNQSLSECILLFCLGTKRHSRMPRYTQWPRFIRKIVEPITLSEKGNLLQR